MEVIREVEKEVVKEVIKEVPVEVIRYADRAPAPGGPSLRTGRDSLAPLTLAPVSASRKPSVAWASAENLIFPPDPVTSNMEGDPGPGCKLAKQKTAEAEASHAVYAQSDTRESLGSSRSTSSLCATQGGMDGGAASSSTGIGGVGAGARRRRCEITSNGSVLLFDPVLPRSSAGSSRGVIRSASLPPESLPHISASSRCVNHTSGRDEGFELTSARTSEGSQIATKDSASSARMQSFRDDNFWPEETPPSGRRRPRTSDSPPRYVTNTDKAIEARPKYLEFRKDGGSRRQAAGKAIACKQSSVPQRPRTSDARAERKRPSSTRVAPATATLDTAMQVVKARPRYLDFRKDDAGREHTRPRTSDSSHAERKHASPGRSSATATMDPAMSVVKARARYMDFRRDDSGHANTSAPQRSHTFDARAELAKMRGSREV